MALFIMASRGYARFHNNRALPDVCNAAFTSTPATKKDLSLGTPVEEKPLERLWFRGTAIVQPL